MDCFYISEFICAVLTTMHLNIWLGIHLTRLSTEGLGPRHGEVRRAHQMLNAALGVLHVNLFSQIDPYMAFAVHISIVMTTGNGTWNNASAIRIRP